MLPLSSPRWSELDTFFGKPEQVPVVLREWVDAIGFDQEQEIYSRDLFDLFLHQGTITNVAFAVVPWIVEACRHAVPTHRAQYLADVALVELNRLTHGVHFVRDGGIAEPDWLMTDYRNAIEQAQSLAEDALDEPLSEEVQQMLWESMPALFGNAAMANKRRYGRAEDSQ